MRWRKLVDKWTVKWINYWEQQKIEAFLKRVEPYMDAHIAKSKKKDAKDLKSQKENEVKIRSWSQGEWMPTSDRLDDV